MALQRFLGEIVGAGNVLTAPEDTKPYFTDWRRQYHAAAECVVRPASTAEVAAVVALCAREGVAIVPQGGRTWFIKLRGPAEVVYAWCAYPPAWSAPHDAAHLPAVRLAALSRTGCSACPAPARTDPPCVPRSARHRHITTTEGGDLTARATEPGPGAA